MSRIKKTDWAAAGILAAVVFLLALLNFTLPHDIRAGLRSAVMVVSLFLIPAGAGVLLRLFVCDKGRTALALADSVNEAMGGQYEYVYDRSQRRQKREKKELGISAVRGGTIVGEHDVIFAGIDEVVTFSHTAYSKAVFGKGAVAAAKFLKGKKTGRFEMADVIAAK